MRTLLFSLILLTCISLVFLACGQKEADTQAQQEEAVQATEEPAVEGELAANMAIDPVCGMKVNKDEAQFTLEHGGETYYFCMEADKTTFTEQPEKYLAQK